MALDGKILSAHCKVCDVLKDKQLKRDSALNEDVLPIITQEKDELNCRIGDDSEVGGRLQVERGLKDVLNIDVESVPKARLPCSNHAITTSGMRDFLRHTVVA